MRRARPDRFPASGGFTLVESIIVLVLLGIAAVTIVSMQGNIFYGQSGNKDLQVGVQLLQECAEQILARRRRQGYTSVGATTCSSPGNYGGFGAPNITLTDGNGASVTSCAGGSSTCTAVISISLSAGGADLTPVTLQLTKY